MANPQLAKAVLIPMNGDQPDADEHTHIRVQFNPNSLRVGLSNTLKADNAGGSSSAAAQYVEKSESTLSVELLFDTTVPYTAEEHTQAADSQSGDASGGAPAGTGGASNGGIELYSDVRKLTRRVADTFMQPENPDSDKPGAPKRCRFQWGAFVFVGMVSSYSETLDFFAPEGVPLRSTLSLTLKEDRYQYESLDVKAAKRAQPSFVPGSPKTGAAQAQTAAGQAPGDWRNTAMHNGMENPRASGSSGLSVPPSDSTRNNAPGAGGQPGYQSGNSGSLGTDVPGAFPGTGGVSATRVRADQQRANSETGER